MAYHLDITRTLARTITWYCRRQNDGTVDGKFDGIFDSILLDPELGIIYGNPLGSNDCTELDPLLGTSEGIK